MVPNNPFFDDRSDSERTRQALTPAKIKKIKEATGNKCEMCRKKYPLHNLKVHHIVPVHTASGQKDLNTQSNLLVLCSICHDNVHAAKPRKAITKSRQKELIKKRPEKVKKDIQDILRNRQKINDNSTNSQMRGVKIASPNFDQIRIDTPDFFGSGRSKKKGKTKDPWDFF